MLGLMVFLIYQDTYNQAFTTLGIEATRIVRAQMNNAARVLLALSS